MIVGSFRNFGEFASFDPTSGALEPNSETRDQEYLNNEEHGIYAHLGGQLAVLYGLNHSLYARIGVDLFKIDNDTAVEWTCTNGFATLVIDDGSSKMSWTYPSDVSPDFVVTTESTFGEEAEDFDFGLFIFNVANDADRRGRIYPT